MVLLLALLLAVIGSAGAQQPAPTLVPPTLVPSGQGGGAEDFILTQSAVDRIVRNNRVRVGVLYNEPPFGELNIRGEIIGFDADLARAMAETWGVELRLRQVTRQTAEDMLDRGAVDMIIAAQVHYREFDGLYEFSQTYHLSSQVMMVRADDPAKTLGEMAGRRVGVVIGTSAEQALDAFMARSGISFQIERFLTRDRLYAGLRTNLVDGIVASQHRLLRAASAEPDLTRFIEEPIELEPYVIAMQRQDINMRNLVNKTLQFLQRSGKLAEIRQVHFPDVTYDDLAVWDGLAEEAPKPTDFTAAVTFPQQYILPRIQSDRTLRVAGIKGLTVNDTEIAESERRVEIFHRQLMDAIAQRWGVTVQYIPATPEEAVELVRNGQADVALGIEPNWSWTDRVDFTGPYLLRGLRLMVRKNSNVFGFTELGGSQWIAVTTEDAGVREEVFANAQRANVLVEVLETSELNFTQSILEDSNADVAFADSIRLLPHLEANPDEFQLTTRWYTRDYLSMAVPRNDLDFRLLLDYTLQEMTRDGTLNELLKPLLPPDETPKFDVWPGTGSTFGFSITR